MKKLSLLLVFAMSLLPALSANSQAQDQGTPVQMTVTVEARHGNTPPEITREDVMVYEGHDRDKVATWVPAQGDQSGLEFFILLDDGASISLGSQLEDLRGFIDGQPPSTKIGVAYMQNGVAQVVQELTNDHARAAKSLRLPLGTPGVNGSPYFSLQDLIKRWPATTERREVLMVTDGVDRYGETPGQDPYVDAAVADAQRAGVIVYDIYTPGVGHVSHSYWLRYWGQMYLSQIAEETGGESYYIGFSGAPVSLSPYLDEVSHRLGHQYLLTFLPKPEKKAGLRRIKLQTEVQNAELVAATQVYVPAVP